MAKKTISAVAGSAAGFTRTIGRRIEATAGSAATVSPLQVMRFSIEAAAGSAVTIATLFLEGFASARRIVRAIMRPIMRVIARKPFDLR